MDLLTLRFFIEGGRENENGRRQMKMEGGR